MNKQEFVNALAECMQLQDSFNSVVNPDWRKAKYAWSRAIWTECAELMEHLQWKWWKNKDGEIDKKQTLLEVVDIFHFVMSDRLIDRRTALDLANSYEWARRHTYANTKEKKLKQVEELVMLCLDKQNFEAAFFQVVIALEINVETMLKYYLGKNALNKFRQDNGYKSGTYRREWNVAGFQFDDNVVLESILESSTEKMSFDNIYSKLKSFYI